ncbi:SDR family NAD(P)-dependent oxidoreductase [Microbacterium sp. NPDC056052]|uniref:SDR family NAD(P)-dependent oxidoreductase n=1 Tax=Microbacterium sp. NPDC056052 TaxID=3345695 RepID=UPI0035DAEA2E
MTSIETRLARQHPLPSRFTRDHTAADVLGEVDLAGKRVLISGGYSGIGLEMTRALSEAGASVVVLARRVGLAAETTRRIERVTVLEADLSDQREIHALVQHLLEERGRFDGVIASAGVMASPEKRTREGWEYQFAVNHLGHFALIGGILPLLGENGARVVMMSSAGHFTSGIRWNDLHFASEPYDPWLAYGQSKSANALFAAELAERGREIGVQAFSVHPGNIMTPLQRHLSTEDQIALGWADASGAPSPALRLKTTEQGASTAVWALTSPELADLSGVYTQDNDVALRALDADMDMVTGGVKSWALDPADSARLWDYSVIATGTAPLV